MKFFTLKKKIILVSLFFISLVRGQDHIAPRLSVILVIDQFAHSYIQKLKPFLKGGLKFMLENGVIYNNAYFPHAMPATATGHAAIATGCFAKDHGIISNKWYDSEGKTVYFPNEHKKESAVFGPDGKSLPYGKSCKRIMVEGVSDQLILNPTSGATNYSFAISIKDRAAIAMAGKLGKAIWYDEMYGIFTTSKAYFDTVPSWLTDFNNEKKIYNLKNLKWDPAFPIKNNPAYDFKYVHDYCCSIVKHRLVGTNISLEKSLKKGSAYGKKEKYAIFTYLPQANKTLIELSLECLDAILEKANRQDKIILWVSFSPLDKLTHLFGPNSLEAIDMIYHLDQDLRRFIRRIYKRVRKKDVFLALTADHGVSPIPEILQKEGLTKARRIDSQKLVDQLNDFAYKKYGLKDLVTGFKSSQFFFKTSIFDALDKNTQEKIVIDFKSILLKTPGIKKVWTYDELFNTTFTKGSIGSFFKNQLYPGRSGYITIQTFPYCQMSIYKDGTGHRTPYECNTHVPLIMYKKGEFETKEVNDRVSMLQFANTFAQVLKIPRPPASVCKILPDLFVIE